MHPLRKEAAVQGHEAPMALCHGLQTPDQHGWKSAIGWDSCRRQSCHECCDFCRCRSHCPQVPLEAFQQPVTLIEATHRVKRRRVNAIRLAVDVVRNDDLQVVWTGLIQAAELPQVARAFAKVPFALVQGDAIEVGQAHATRALALYLHELVLACLTLTVLLTAETLSNLIHHALQARETHAAIAEQAPHDVARKLLDLAPIAVALGNVPLQAVDLICAHGRKILAQDIARKISVQNTLCRLLIQGGPVLELMSSVGCLQACNVLTVNEMLEHSCKNSSILKCKAV
mmetsp:Transcript_9361/g.22055  ORF Transcript_9361/g.22055 Transcript_9361/m.22055 type:complete len:286 (-) Transcript_9361:443-1300(-)